MGAAGNHQPREEWDAVMVMNKDDAATFQAAVRAGMSPARASRYVRYVHHCERAGKKPPTPEQAAEAPRSARA